MTAGLARLHALSPDEAAAELHQCCGSRNWAQRMAGRRPFQDAAALLDAADKLWWELGREDWLEAFLHHPKIGEKAAAHAGTVLTRRWSEQEQSGAEGAHREVLEALAEANRAYEARFGYVFIVCATGKTTEEMLALLRRRLQNDATTELRVAAEEQRRITRLRLEKLLSAVGP